MRLENESRELLDLVVASTLLRDLSQDMPTRLEKLLELLNLVVASTLSRDLSQDMPTRLEELLNY